MPELHKLTPALGVLQDRGQRVAIVTDGRMSGASGKVPGRHPRHPRGRARRTARPGARRRPDHRRRRRRRARARRAPTPTSTRREPTGRAPARRRVGRHRPRALRRLPRHRRHRPTTAPASSRPLDPPRPAGGPRCPARLTVPRRCSTSSRCAGRRPRRRRPRRAGRPRPRRRRPAGHRADPAHPGRARRDRARSPPRCPRSCVGAGTVVTPGQAKARRRRRRAVPGLARRHADAARRRWSTPGCRSCPAPPRSPRCWPCSRPASREMKFFPAEASGGAAYLKSIASPVPAARFCPTGGITAATRAVVPRPAQRRLRRRLLAHPGRRARGRRLGPGRGARGRGRGTALNDHSSTER